MPVWYRGAASPWQPWGCHVWPQAPGSEQEGMKSKLFENKRIVWYRFLSLAALVIAYVLVHRLVNAGLCIAALLLPGSLGDLPYGPSLPDPNMKV